MIRGKFFWFGFLGIALVYLAGLFTRLMENDSAQFAVMAMRMVQEQDFFNLWKGNEEYLDKPHMHYWLAAFSYILFGLADWAYRIPAILATFLGAYSCYGLGSALYSRQTGRIAALIFMSAQTIILSVIDVRTDAVLTGFTIFSIWQLYLYLRDGKLIPLVLGAAGAGLAFSTKGQIALVVIALPLVCQLVYSRSWNRLWNPRLLLGLVVFGLVISPMLYAYYQQFDMYPEKVIRGKDHRSGILFIFWEQSFERLSGEGVGKNSSDYFFFFHTFLWVFLPWTVIGIMAYTKKLRHTLRQRKLGIREGEILTLGGVTLIFLVISFAQFKLPHYLNIVIPLFAVLTGSYLEKWQKDKKWKELKRLAWIQFGIYGLMVLAVLLICIWVFPLDHFFWYIVLFLGIVLGIVLFFRWRHSLLRVVGISLYGSILINLVMNAHFYPNLLTYQGGSEMASLISKEGLPVKTLYKITDQHTWALDFYIGKPVKLIPLKHLSAEESIWVYADQKDMEHLRKAGVTWDREFAVDQFRISRLQASFLNPETRPGVLRKRYLIRVIPPS